MSLLADLLARIKQSSSKREVPPNLKSIVQSSSRGSGDKRKIILLSCIFAAAVLSGLLLTYVGRSLFDTESSLTTTVPIRTLAPVADSGMEQESRAIEAVAGHQEGGPAVQSASPSITEGSDAATASPSAGEPADSESVSAQMEEEEDVQPPVAERALAGAEEKRDRMEHTTVPKKDAFLYAARKYELNNDYLNALTNYKHALNMEPEDVMIMNTVAFMYLKLSLYEEAVTYAQMALERDSDYVPALINMAIANAQLGNSVDAERYFEQAAERDRDNQSVLLNLAILHERQENFDKALQLYAHLGKLGSATGKMGEARMYERQGDRKRATELYRAISVSEAVEDTIRIEARKRLMVLISKR